jgi:hypothetical protein
MPPLVQTDTTEHQCGPLVVDFFVLEDAAEILVAQSNFNQLLKIDLANA